MSNGQPNFNSKQNSTSMKILHNRLKDVRNFSDWSAKEQMIAVSAVGVIAGALLPFMLVALPVAAAGAAVALTLFFAYKVVEYTFKGLKWSAEKTVEGAKYTARKIEAGAVHAKDKVREGVDSLKKRFKERDRVVFYNHAKEGAAIEKMTKFPEENRKKAGEIKHELKAIFADKGNNAGLVQNILSGILSEIDLKMAEEAKSGWMERTPDWQVQKDFIKHLGEKNLRVLIKQKALPSDVYFIDSVFSEHYDEIKKVIKECKENHLYSIVSNMFEKAEKKANRPSAKGSARSVLSPFSSLGRKGSTQLTSSTSENSLSDVDSIKTDSTASSKAELLPEGHNEEKQSSGRFSRWLPWNKGSKAPEVSDVVFIDNPIYSANQTATVASGEQPIPVASPKVPESGSQKPDYVVIDIEGDAGYHSGRSSPDSFTPTGRQSPVNLDPFGSVGVVTGLPNPLTPKRINLSSDDLNKSRLNKTGNMDKLVGQQPSTKVDGNVDAQPQTTPKSVV